MYGGIPRSREVPGTTNTGPSSGCSLGREAIANPVVVGNHVPQGTSIAGELVTEELGLFVKERKHVRQKLLTVQVYSVWREGGEGREGRGGEGGRKGGREDV